MKKRVYFFLEFKRILKTALHTFMGAIVLAVLVGTVAFCASRVLYGQKLMDVIRIGIVLDTEDEVTSNSILGMTMSFLENMESVKTTCEFVYCEEADAMNALDKHELDAVMIVPESLVGDIIDGTNTPVQVLFSKEDSLSASMLQVLTDAGAKTLSVAQAGIYAVYDIFVEQGMQENLQDAYDYLNGKYLNLALARSRTFHYEEISVTGPLTTEMYYAVNGCILILFLSGMSLAGVLRKENEALQSKLRMSGITPPLHIGIRFCALFVLYFVLSLIVLIGLGGFSKGIWMPFIGALLMSMVLSAWFMFVYAMVESEQGGIMLNFLLSLVLVFMGGGIVPLSYLPEIITKLGRRLPAGSLLELCHQLMAGTFDFSVAGMILVNTIILLALTIGIRYIREHRYDRNEKMSTGKIGGCDFMPKQTVWFFMTIKRIIKQKVIVIVGLIFAVLLTCLGTSKDQGLQVKCGIYVENEEDAFLSDVSNKLLNSNGIVDFYLCDSRVQLERDVATGKAECGYVLPQNLEVLLSQEKNKNLMTTIVSPSTVSSRLIDEIVFSCVFEVYAPQILMEYLKEEMPEITESKLVDAAELQKQHMIDGSTFSFEYNQETATEYKQESIFASIDDSLYGIFVFLCALLGGYVSVNDRKNRIYGRLDLKRRSSVYIHPILATTLVAGIIALVLDWILGGVVGAGFDLVRMAGYLLCVCGYVTVICNLLSTPKNYCMALTLLGMGSLLAIFVELGFGDYLPAIRMSAMIFPSVWFVKASWAGALWMLGVGALMCLSIPKILRKCE